MQSRLDCLSAIAIKNSHKPGKHSTFYPISDVRCDGIEINLGAVPSKAVDETKNELKNYIHRDCPELIIKNLLVCKNHGQTKLWVTLHDMASRLERTQVESIIKMRTTV